MAHQTPCHNKGPASFSHASCYLLHGSLLSDTGASLSLSHPPNELRGVRPLSICSSDLVSTADWCTSARDGGWGARVVLGQLLGSLAFKVRNSTVTLIYGSALANVFLWSVKIFALASNVHSNCSLSMQQVVHYVMLTTVKLHMACLCSAQLSTPAHALY